MSASALSTSTGAVASQRGARGASLRKAAAAPLRAARASKAVSTDVVAAGEFTN
jgi:hypothetical protein